MAAESHEPPRILVVSACSKKKVGADELPLFGGTELLPARDRYAGRGHQRVRAAIDRWREAQPTEVVEWAIVSAGCGVLDEHTEIPNYNATFAGMSPAAAAARGRELGVSDGLEARLPDYDIAVFVLSMAYLHASAAPFGEPARRIYFASPHFEDPALGAAVVPCGVDDARTLGVAPREVGAARFEAFVSEVLDRGLDSAVAMATGQLGAVA